MIRRTLPAVMVLSLAAALHPAAAAASGTWVWPVTGPVIRGFDPPDDPYGAGHRGIDIAAPVGTPVLAAEAGTVTFGGKVGGQLFVSVDHGGGLVSSYSWVSALRVRKNDVVCLIGLKLHILDHGSTFNLHTRVAAAAPVLAHRVEGSEVGDKTAKRGSR